MAAPIITSTYSSFSGLEKHIDLAIEQGMLPGGMDPAYTGMCRFVPDMVAAGMIPQAGLKIGGLGPVGPLQLTLEGNAAPVKAPINLGEKIPTLQTAKRKVSITKQARWSMGDRWVFYKAQSLGAEINKYFNTLLAQLYITGYEGTSFALYCTDADANKTLDGKYLFADDHTYGGDNKRASLGLSAANLESASTTLMNMTDAEGRPAGAEPRRLIVGPTNALLARKLVGSEYASQAAATSGAHDLPFALNIFGNMELVVNPFLAGDRFFVADPNMWDIHLVFPYPIEITDWYDKDTETFHIGASVSYFIGVGQELGIVGCKA